MTPRCRAKPGCALYSRRSVLAALSLGVPAAAATAEIGEDAFPDDPFRPRYHLQPARGWMNDPCAPLYWRDRYHMFFQYNPNAAVWGDMHWAHADSPDMLRWRLLPVALAPTPDGPDAAGCFTGSAAVQDGVPTIIYTAVERVPVAAATLSDGNNNFRETQCLATSRDPLLLTWTKEPRPVLAAPPAGLKVTGFRDPTPWRQGEFWYLLVASGIPRKGGLLLLYRSRDLRAWEYLQPFASGTWSGKSGKNPVDTGEMWECPDFFPLGNGHVLIYSTQGKTIWQSGQLDESSMRFHAERTGQLDYGTYYAPKTQLDAQGNRILWGWIPETRPSAEYSRAGWSGLMSLPRLLTLVDGELRMQPAPGVTSLRRTTRVSTANVLVPDLQQEVACSFISSGGDALTFSISDAAGPLLEVHSDVKQDPRTLRFNDVTVPLSENFLEKVDLRVFLDNSVMELFIGDRYAVTKRFYARASGRPIGTLALPGSWKLAHAESAELRC